MKWLGLDFGLKNIGLSVAEGPLAEPLLETKLTAPDQLLKLIKAQVAELVVLGLPEGPMSKEVKQLGELISKRLKIPVAYQDETLSTQEAKARLLQAGAPQQKRRRDHSAAAAVILQDYLDDHYQA